MKIIKLKNELAVIFIQNKNIDYISIEFKVKAGSNYENLDEIGVAHITEHLILSKHSEILQRYGGKVWGITSRDDSIIYIKILKEYFEEAIEYLSKILLEKSYSNEDLLTQKRIIGHEIKRSLSNPEKIILRKSYKTLFPKTRMEILNTGEITDIEKVDLEKTLNFKNKHYTSLNSVIAITGNITETELIKALEKKLSSLSKGRKISEPKIKINNMKSIEKISGNFNQKHIKIDFNGYTLKNKNRYSLSILGFLINNQLNQIIKIKKGLCYVINAKDFYSPSFGTFGVYTATDELKIIDVINKEILNFVITDIEIAKINVISELIFSLENPSQLLDFYTTNYLFDNNISLQQEIENYKRVSKNDILKAYNYIVTQKQKITIIE